MCPGRPYSKGSGAHLGHQLLPSSGKLVEGHRIISLNAIELVQGGQIDLIAMRTMVGLLAVNIYERTSLLQ
jgi:hypothetical protein